MTKVCKTKQSEVQIPSSSIPITEDELILSAYNFLTCYKLSDDGATIDFASWWL